VQGTVRAEPMTITQGKERFTLRFDCKPCEMHVVGKIKPSVIKQQAREVSMKFYRTQSGSFWFSLRQTRPQGL
jgi:hypothetical protein